VEKKKKKNGVALPEMSSISPALCVLQEEDTGLREVKLLDQGSLLALIHSQFHARDSCRRREASQAHSRWGGGD